MTHPLYEHLRDLRNARGLSIEKAAPKLGIHPSVLGSWETGRRQPSVTQYDDLAGKYGERLAAIPADVTDQELAAALAWITVQRVQGELRAVA